MNAPGVVLQVSDVVKRFGENVVLQGIDLSLREREIVAIMGANGAGKSTLVKILSGVHVMDSGALSIAGHEQHLSSPAAARAAGIVSVHQVVANTGVASLSVAENLSFDALCGASMPFFTTPGSIVKRAKRIAEESGLDLDLTAPFASLGLAERQMVAIARAISSATRILILDEPTASLSAGEAERLFVMLDRLRAKGLGVLFISHRLADLERLADRVVVLRHGRIAGEFDKPLDLAAATSAMMGRPIVRHDRTREGGKEWGGMDDNCAPAPQIPSAAHPIVVSLSAVTLASTRQPEVGRSADSAGATQSDFGTDGLTTIGNATVTAAHVAHVSAAAPHAIHLDLYGGEITVVTGSLGAGKTRLLETLFGLHATASGDIKLAGTTAYPATPAQAIDAGVFLVGEDRWRTSLSAPDTLGADLAGTIALPHWKKWSGRWGWVDRARSLREAVAAIRRLGIVCRGPTDRLENLSGGNQQKVVVARWLARPSRLLLLDEPFQGVDLGARSDLIAALRALGPHTAVLIATNDMEEALEAADRLLVMRDRSIVADHRIGVGTLDGLLSRIAGLEKESMGEAA